jgi:hypothetical protein
MYYLRARYYDPAVGRFLTSDPHQGNPQSPQSLNKYAYVENDPVNNTDPRGLYSRWQGSKIHQEIGRYYIERHGDYFVDVLKKAPNKGFPPSTGGGLGAYNRNILSDLPFRLYVDLRHYGYVEDYEIKPLLRRKQESGRLVSIHTRGGVPGFLPFQQPARFRLLRRRLHRRGRSSIPTICCETSRIQRL